MNGRQALSKDFYLQDTPQVARQLIGKRIVRQTRDGTTSGVIVETEAYLASGDAACHAARGKTRRNATMFGPPGRLYVYTIHARWCMNAVTEPAGRGAAVLIRAIEPTVGIDLMIRRRGRSALLDLARGPARLCEAFAVDGKLDGWDLTAGSRIWIEESNACEAADLAITASPRIGISSAREAPLRFFVDGCRFVSGPRRFHSAALR